MQEIARACDLSQEASQGRRGSANGDAARAGGAAGAGVWRRASVVSRAAAALYQAWLRNRETALAGHPERSSRVVQRGRNACRHASYDGTARVWDLRGERPSFVALKGHQGPVYSAAFSPDGTHVVTASDGQTARVWDLRGEQPSFVALEGHQVRSIPRRSAPTERMWSPRPMTRRRGCGICAGSSRVSSPSKAIRVGSSPRRSAPTERMSSRRQTTRRRGCGICAATGRASSPSKGIRIRSPPHRSAPTERMWSRRQMTRRRGCGICARAAEFVALEGHSGRGRLRVVQRRRTHVVTASRDGTARVWDLRGEQPSFVALEGHEGLRQFRGVQRRRNAVVTASNDNTARVWDLRGEQPSVVASKGIRVTSSPRCSAPTERMWSRRRTTRRRGCGICARRAELRRPRRASGSGHLRIVQRRRNACGHGVR